MIFSVNYFFRVCNFSLITMTVLSVKITVDLKLKTKALTESEFYAKLLQYSLA